MCRRCEERYLDEGSRKRPPYISALSKHSSRFDYYFVEYILDNLCPDCAQRRCCSNFCDYLQECGLTKVKLGSRTSRVREAESKEQNPVAWKVVDSWKAQENLYIYGPNGVGKTFLARELLRRHARQFELVAETDIRQIRSGFLAYGEPRELYEKLKQVPLLLIDDIDKGIDERSALTAIFDLLDARYSEGKGARRTIVTTNVAREALFERMKKIIDGNSSLACGVFERMKPYIPVHMSGKSLRPSAVTTTKEIV